MNSSPMLQDEQDDKDMIAKLDEALNDMLDRQDRWVVERKALQTELALVKDQLKAIFEGNGSVGVGVLQEIALNPDLDPNLRLRAAQALLQTERPKLSAVMTTATTPKLFDILERAKSQGKVIEQAPGPDSAA